MTTFEIPDEPTDLHTVWTQDAGTGAAIRWDRKLDANGRAVGWTQSGGGGGWVGWLSLLGQGPVFDEHPDLTDLALPWSAAGRDVLDDADYALLQVDGPNSPADDERIARFIVLAVNAYTEQRLGPAADEVV